MTLSHFFPSGFFQLDEEFLFKLFNELSCYVAILLIIIIIIDFHCLFTQQPIYLSNRVDLELQVII